MPVAEGSTWSLFIPGAVVFEQPLENLAGGKRDKRVGWGMDLDVASSRSKRRRVAIDGAALSVRVLQDVEVAVLGS